MHQQRFPSAPALCSTGPPSCNAPDQAGSKATHPHDPRCDCRAACRWQRGRHGPPQRRWACWKTSPESHPPHPPQATRGEAEGGAGSLGGGSGSNWRQRGVVAAAEGRLRVGGTGAHLVRFPVRFLHLHTTFATFVSQHAASQNDQLSDARAESEPDGGAGSHAAPAALPVQGGPLTQVPSGSFSSHSICSRSCPA